MTARPRGARFDGIVSCYLGATASNRRRVFACAARSPSLLFFNEFDALGNRRDDAQDVGELKRVVSSFLQILDSYPRDKLVVTATNHEGLLDPALRRRFDEVLHFGKPTPAQLVRLIELRLGSVRRGPLDVAALEVRELDQLEAARKIGICLETVTKLEKGRLHAAALEARGRVFDAIASQGVNDRRTTATSP